jgi:hypothetical protein
MEGFVLRGLLSVGFVQRSLCTVPKICIILYKFFMYPVVTSLHPLSKKFVNHAIPDEGR